ncbi:MAG TPA: hypothetical protein V6D03_00815 [Candidatus Caenarcaniphilales bacterium]
MNPQEQEKQKQAVNESVLTPEETPSSLVGISLIVITIAIFLIVAGFYYGVLNL